MGLARDKVYELTPELISNSSSPYFFKSSNKSSNGLDYEIENRLIFLKKYYEEIISNKK